MNILGFGPEHRPSLVSSGAWLFGFSATVFLLSIIFFAISVPAGAPQKSAVEKPPEVMKGENIFRGEGCIECHRLVSSEWVQSVEFKETHSVREGLSSGWFGGRSIGPPLINSGDRFIFETVKKRLKDPRMLEPNTVMPSYEHLNAMQIEALTAFLNKPDEVELKWAEVRQINGIEPVIPDKILERLAGYIDPQSGIINLPVDESTQSLIIGNGLFNSRCAGCHILDKTTNSPKYSLKSEEHNLYTKVMWYYRMTEGVPGTAMPAWKNSLSEMAVWYLVGFLKNANKEIETSATEKNVDISVVQTEYDISVVSSEYDFAQASSVESELDAAILKGEE